MGDRRPETRKDYGSRIHWANKKSVTRPAPACQPASPKLGWRQSQHQHGLTPIFPARRTVFFEGPSMAQCHSRLVPNHQCLRPSELMFDLTGAVAREPGEPNCCK